jgi:hypothetical protein
MRSSSRLVAVTFSKLPIAVNEWEIPPQSGSVRFGFQAAELLRVAGMKQISSEVGHR